MNAYCVLGVEPSASLEVVKKAYHELIKKYHPDNFSRYDDPTVAEIMDEKVKEITAAYESIVNGTAGQYDESTGNAAVDQLVRSAKASIDQDNWEAALDAIEQVMNQVAPVQRTEEMCALAAAIYMHNSDPNKANEYIDAAIEKHPCAEHYINKANIFLDSVIITRSEIKEILKSCHLRISKGKVPQPTKVLQKNPVAAQKYLELINEYADLVAGTAGVLEAGLNYISASDDPKDAEGRIYGLLALVAYYEIWADGKGKKQRKLNLEEYKAKAANLGDPGQYVQSVADLERRNV